MEDDSADRSAPASDKQRDFNVEESTLFFPMPTAKGDRFLYRQFHDTSGLSAATRRFGIKERTPLHSAASSSSYDTVLKLLEEGENVNATDEYGNTPLHQAVKNRSIDIVSLLIHHGADTNATNKHGSTPLHEAAKSGSEKIVSILIDRKSDVNATDRYGKTPLHKAATSGSEKSILMLIDQGANVNATDRYGRTPLHYAIVRDRYVIERDSHDLGDEMGIGSQSGAVNENRAVRLLIDKKAIVDALDINDRTPLHFAVDAGSAAAVTELVQGGANIALRDKYGRTPIYNASRLILRKFEVFVALGVNWPAKVTRFLWEPLDAFKATIVAGKALETLENSISLIRQEAHVVATTLGAFAQDKYGDWGMRFLLCIASAFTAHTQTHVDGEIHIEVRPSEIQVISSKFPDRVKEFLTWLCLSFREPQDQVVGISKGEYVGNTFILETVKPVLENGHSNPSCWYGLFESVVIAEDPDTSSTQPISDCWLQVSFDLMIQISAVEYPLILDRGIILMGYSTALVPVRMVDDTHVLWHLEVAEHDSQLSISELAAIKSRWLQVDNLDQLRAKKALIGWCPEATILLGTNKLDPNPTWSKGKVKKTSWRWSGANLQFLAQTAAPAQIGAQLGLSMSRTTNTLRFTPSKNYLKCLNNSATEHVILYDLAAERAWLVPLLSTFHHMLAIYWNTIPAESRCPTLPLATPSADGALASLTILKKHGDSIVEGSAMEKCTIRDLMMGFSTNLSRIPAHPPSRNEIYGYELMDIVVDSAMADLKRKKIKKEGLGWAPLLSQVRCLFCSGIGNAIIGNKARDLNSPCNEMPCGSDLMAATIPSINALSRRSGNVSQGSLCRLSTLHVWELTGNPFTRCQHRGSSRETCWHTMHFLQEIQSKTSNGQVQGSGTAQLTEDGAVVFGQQKRGIVDSKSASVLSYRF